MKKTLLFCALCLCTLVARAEVSVTAASSYIWRGLELDEDPVLQPEVSYGNDYVSFSAWANHDFEEFNEVDLTASATYKWLEVGAIQYLYPYADGETWEAYGSVAYNVCSLTGYYDLDAVEGALYGTVEIAPAWKTLEIAVWLSGANAEYSETYFEEPEDQVTDCGVSLEYPVPVKDGFTLVPGATATYNFVTEETLGSGHLSFNF